MRKMLLSQSEIQYEQNACLLRWQSWLQIPNGRRLPSELGNNMEEPEFYKWQVAGQKNPAVLSITYEKLKVVILRRFATHLKSCLSEKVTTALVVVVVVVAGRRARLQKLNVLYIRQMLGPLLKSHDTNSRKKADLCQYLQAILGKPLACRVQSNEI